MTAHDSALVEKAAAALRLVVAYRELYAVPTLENTTNPSMVSRVPSDQTPQWRYRNYVTTVLDAVADDLREQGRAEVRAAVEPVLAGYNADHPLGGRSAYYMARVRAALDSTEAGETL